MQCAKCQQEMQKKEILDSGNIKLQRWQCNSCYTEQSEALGLSGGMPDWA